MKRILVLVSVLALGAFGPTGAFAEETLDTLLPPPSWFRRSAEKLGVDAQTRQRFEQLYEEKEPKYHQLRYKVERLSNRLFEALDVDELDEELIVERMRTLLEAENELKLYQVHVRISLLSEASPEQWRAARELARQQPPTSDWRGGIQAKVAQVRDLSKRLSESGGSIEEIENKMIEVDRTMAAGEVSKGVVLLDQVIRELTASLESQ